jgi:hypothetical protein
MCEEFHLDPIRGTGVIYMWGMAFNLSDGPRERARAAMRAMTRIGRVASPLL